MQDLKPCPFCGSKEIELEETDSFDNPTGGTVDVSCAACEAMIRCTTDEEAVSAWNKRVATTSNNDNDRYA